MAIDEAAGAATQGEQTSSPTRHKLETVQVLRAVGAALVVGEHVLREAIDRFGVNYDGALFPWGMGVDIFFVISGYIMFRTSLGQFGTSGARRRFLTRRAVRVLPTYYLFTTLMLVVVLAMPSALGKTTFDPLQIVCSYLFFPYMTTDGSFFPLLPVGWTLNYEIAFYAIFALFLSLSARCALVATTGVLTALILANLLFPDTASVLTFWGNPIVLEFCAGMAIGAIGGAAPRSRWGSFALVVVAAVAWAWIGNRLAPAQSGFIRLAQLGVPAATLVFAATRLVSAADSARAPRFAVALGDSSYALYLSHRFTLRTLSLVWDKVLGFAPVLGGLYMGLGFVLCIVAGHLAYIVLERPVLLAINHSIRSIYQSRVRGLRPARPEPPNP